MKTHKMIRNILRWGIRANYKPPIIVANLSKFGNLDKPGMWTKTQFVFLDKAK